MVTKKCVLPFWCDSIEVWNFVRPGIWWREVQTSDETTMTMVTERFVERLESFYTKIIHKKCLKIAWKLFERDCLKLFLIMISQCNSHVLNEKDAFKVIRIWPRFVAQVLPELWNFSKSGKFERHDLLLRSFENKSKIKELNGKKGNQIPCLQCLSNIRENWILC